MIPINNFISDIPPILSSGIKGTPWAITSNIKEILRSIIPTLGSEFKVEDEVAVHKSSVVEHGVILKGPVLIMENTFIGANSYFRGGVFLGSSVKIGPCSEIKSSLLLSRTSAAHMNYIGNSLVGNNVNFEAGSITANHYNERANKRITVCYRSTLLDTGVEKFGALIGDYSRIGANAVLSPGTILEKNSIVKRLELVEQKRL